MPPFPQVPEDGQFGALKNRITTDVQVLFTEDGGRRDYSVNEPTSVYFEVRQPEFRQMPRVASRLGLRRDIPQDMEWDESCLGCHFLRKFSKFITCVPLLSRRM